MSNLKKIYTTVNKGNFPDKINIEIKKESDLRYGENPNQPAALYKSEKSPDITLLKTGKGGLSGTNIMDITRAMEILKFFTKPSCAVMKHLIPSGFATEFSNNTLKEIYINARDADARSAFGSVVVFNKTVDKETSEEILSSYVEAVAAPNFDKCAIELLSERKNIRLLQISGLERLPKYISDSNDTIDTRSIGTGRILCQSPYLSKIESKKDLIINPIITKDKEYKVQNSPTDKELDDLFTAWYINIGTRSNGIIIVKNGTTLAIGSGQQERVGAVEQCILKAYQKAMDRKKINYKPLHIMENIQKLKNNPLQGAVVSSDAFFPFRDSIDLLAEHGIKSIIQPGGSIRDSEVIEAVNEHNMSMVFTTERCFAHF